MLRKIKIDRLDRKILLELDQDARQTLSSLAKKVRLGSDLVEYRVQRMVKEGVIQHFSTQIDVTKLGYNIYNTHLRRRNDSGKSQSLIKYLSKHPSLYWLAEWYGEWDLLFSLTARNPREFQIARDKIFNQFSDEIISFETTIKSSVSRFTKGYLLEQRGEKIVYAKSNQVFTLDDLEKNLLKLMANNARLSYVQLAELLKSTPAIIKYRIQKLEQAQVIAGYRLQLNYHNLNMLVFKLALNPSNYDPKVAERLEQFCEKSPFITCFIKQLGGSPYEIEAEFFNYSEFHILVDQLREQFDTEIESITHLILREDHYHRFCMADDAG